MQHGMERGYVLDMYLPNQMNSPICLVTVYVLTEPVRRWPSFRRGDVEVIKKMSRGLGKENENSSAFGAM